ncbi:MAG: acyl-CoA synthetase, partial [Candidatus Abyssubacteria bacterium]|nr:acyl-CoA synthetase [Candidatus Abyssubacteria bacterium]
LPKKVTVIDPMPVTAIGKIFKPALRYDAIKKVFDAELEQLSDIAESIEVTVKEHKVHGTVAHITAKPASGTDEKSLRNQIESVLGHYTVHYDVSIAGA